jgi:hypothetical protein
MLFTVRPVHFLRKEEPVNDLIFNSNDNQNAYTSDMPPAVQYDKDYNNPDKEMYIFSTMGKGINALYSNNILIPIRTKFRLGHYNLSMEVNKRIKNAGNGIFIVEYFTIFNTTNTSMDGVVDYYLKTNNLEYDEDTIDNIIGILTSRKGNNEPMKYTFRIISFIPEKDIKEYGYVHIPSAGVILVDGIPDSNISYPTSKSYTNNLGIGTKHNKNMFMLEIIDNQDNKPYFIKVGNSTKRIFPTRDLSRPEQCRMVFERNNRVIEEYEIPLKDMGKELGIYQTEKEAMTLGSPEVLLAQAKASIEEKKIALEENKLVNDYKKLIIEMDNLVYKSQVDLMLGKQKLEASELDILKKNIEMEALYRKSIIDVKSMTLKANIELRHITQKNKTSATKDFLDNSIKVIGLASSAYKLFL